MKALGQVARGAVYGAFCAAIVELVDSGPWWAIVLVVVAYTLTLRYVTPREERRDWSGSVRRFAQDHPMALPLFTATLAVVGVAVSVAGVDRVDAIAIGLGAGIMAASLASVGGLPDPWDERARR